MGRFSKFFSLVGFKKTKGRRHMKQKRRNTRRRYMRGGWGGSSPATVNLNNVNLTGMKGGMKGVMKGGWGPAPPM